MLNLRVLAVGALAVAAAMAFALAACANDAADTPGSVDVGGVKRTYVAHVPSNLGKNVPLVLVFHGHFMTGEQQSHLTHLDVQSDKLGFIAVYPDGIRRGWSDGRPGDRVDDIGFTKALIANFSHRYSIDPKRIYATGFSNGATFSQYLGCNLANQIAAIAPVSGPIPTLVAPNCHPSRAISVLEIGGTTDPIVPFTGGEITIATMKRGMVLGTEQTVAFWAKNAHCRASAKVHALSNIAPSDGTSIARSTYASCSNGTDVVLYTVTGGGHTWPGGAQYLPKAMVGTASKQLDASQTIVEFLLAHPMVTRRG
jgi:polyhydroxybutyrate depolymerase